MSSSALKLLAASGAKGDPVYVDDVFSTFLYKGNGSTQTITNGIDLSGEGGLVWAKMRSGTPADGSNVLYDTERGAGKYLISNNNAAQSATDSVALTSFNSNGFSLGADNASGLINYGSRVYASWSFRKAPGFFDIVTYTGNGSTSSRTLSHNLGSTPGHIIFKKTSSGTQNWYNMAKDGTNYRALSLNDAGGSFGSTAQSNVANGTTLDVGYLQGWGGFANDSGATYVAYIFAHDAQEFGTDSDESIIKCGTFSGQGQVDLGFEPQWILVKPYNQSYNWLIVDNIRSLPTTPYYSTQLNPNLSRAETAGMGITINSTGFANDTFGSSYPCIYIAIRRPNKPASEFAATDLFNADLLTDTYVADIGFPVDLAISKYTTLGGTGATFHPRLTGLASQIGGVNTEGMLRASDSGAEGTSGEVRRGDSSTGYTIYPHNYERINYGLRRAPGFFDVVTYTGNGTAGATQAHQLGVAPELIFVKYRNATSQGLVYNKTITASKYLMLFSTSAGNTAATADTGGFNGTEPTSSVFTLGPYSNVNTNGGTYIAFLFASVDGISKVGSYTGTGNDLNVACGFSAGARFILIKRTDATGDWYLWDSFRGIVAGNDPYILLNSGAAQVTNTDYIDPLASGFTVTSSAPAALNASGGTYIFLAIA